MSGRNTFDMKSNLRHLRPKQRTFPLLRPFQGLKKSKSNIRLFKTFY